MEMPQDIAREGAFPDEAVATDEAVVTDEAVTTNEAVATNAESAEAPEKLSLKANMMWSSVGSLTRLGCNYLVSSVLVVRLATGFDAAGMLALAMAIANLVNPIADFRLRTVQVTDVTGERTSREYVGLRSVLSIVAFLVGVVYSVVTTSYDALPVISLYLVYSLATNFIEVFHAIDQRHLRLDFAGKSYVMQGIGTLVAFAVGLWFFDSLLVAVGLMTAVVILVGALYDAPRACVFEPIRPQVRFGRAAKTLVSLAPLVVAQIAATSVLTVPRQMLAASDGAEALGVYQAVASLAVIVQMGATYVYSPLMGVFAERFHSNKRSALTLLWKTVGAIVAIAAVAALGLEIVGEPVLTLLFGEKIRGNTFLLQPAVLCTVITAFGWFFNDLLLSVRDYVASFVGNVVACIVALVLARPFVNWFGMNGVSWVGVAGYASGVLVLAIFLAVDYRRLKDAPVDRDEEGGEALQGA